MGGDHDALPPPSVGVTTRSVGAPGFLSLGTRAAACLDIVKRRAVTMATATATPRTERPFLEGFPCLTLASSPNCLPAEAVSLHWMRARRCRSSSLRTIRKRRRIDHDRASHGCRKNRGAHDQNL